MSIVTQRIPDRGFSDKKGYAGQGRGCYKQPAQKKPKQSFAATSTIPVPPVDAAMPVISLMTCAEFLDLRARAAM